MLRKWKVNLIEKNNPIKGSIKGSSANLILLCNRSEMLIIKSSKLALDPLTNKVIVIYIY